MGVSPDCYLLAQLWMEDGFEPLDRRALIEAGLATCFSVWSVPLLASQSPA